MTLRRGGTMEALDGNVLAGALHEYFGREMTSTTGECSHCGTRAVLAELSVYGSAPGAVVRCRAWRGDLPNRRNARRGSGDGGLRVPREGASNTRRVPMKSLFTRCSPAVVISSVALFVALGGIGVAAIVVSTANNAKHLGGQKPSFFLQYRHLAYSHGERFLKVGQTVVLGRAG